MSIEVESRGGGGGDGVDVAAASSAKVTIVPTSRGLTEKEKASPLDHNTGLRMEWVS